jgi:hypothetical protein
MAKKKKKVHPRRRRRVGGVHPKLQAAVLDVAGAAAGGLAAAFANQAIKTAVPTMPAWIGGAFAIAAGGAIILMAKPSPMVDSFATGLIAGGALFAVNETFLSVPGISGVPPVMPMPGGYQGYINKTVGNTRLPNRMGNMSGNGSAVLAGIMEN